MLTQNEADALIAMQKQLVGSQPILFPLPGGKAELPLISTDGREKFIADVNRGRIRLTKCTYQERYNTVVILLRLDVGGPPHENPDGVVVPCPHLHVFREDAADRWAVLAPLDKFTNLADLAATLREFLTYCNVANIPQIEQELF